jgi:hypothetical protein
MGRFYDENFRALKKAIAECSPEDFKRASKPRRLKGVDLDARFGDGERVIIDWLYGGKSVAAYMGISERTFWRHVNKPGFPVQRYMGCILSRKIWVEKWKKRQRVFDPRRRMRIRVRAAMKRIRDTGK